MDSRRPVSPPPRIVDLLLPARCPGCGETAAPALCPACTASVRPASELPPPPGLDWWVAAFAYEGPVRELIARAKYRRARAGLPWLAGEVAAAVRAAGRPVDIVSWPPTTALRRRNRGFDPAEALARQVAAALGRPVEAWLERCPGPPQTGRRREERIAGPRFSVLDTSPPAGRPLAGRAILLVDDVTTTGGTLAAAGRALRTAGPAIVGAATGGRTEPQR